MPSMRCGYCGKGEVYGKTKTVAPLVPVIVTSRGMPHSSKSHRHCIQKWQNISDVRLAEPQSQSERDILEDAKRYLEQHKYGSRSEYYKKRYREFMEQGGNHCAECGQPITKNAKHCMHHASKQRWVGVPRKYANKAERQRAYIKRLSEEMQNKCKDCGTPISIWGKRCPTCFHISRRKKTPEIQGS